jgi:iron complex outermembrane recepter protein
MKITNTIMSICLLFLFSTSWAQQTASIKGRITLSDNSGADNVSIVIKGTQIGAATDNDGNYEIKNLKAGNYVIKVSAVGFSSKEKAISLNSGDEII